MSLLCKVTLACSARQPANLQAWELKYRASWVLGHVQADGLFAFLYYSLLILWSGRDGALNSLFSLRIRGIWMACYIMRRNYSVVQNTQGVNVQIQDIDCAAWKFKREGRNKCIYIYNALRGGGGEKWMEMYLNATILKTIILLVCLFPWFVYLLCHHCC